MTKHARERRERDRLQFKDDVAALRPEQFVNLDESAYDRHTAGRSHGWSVKGERAKGTPTDKINGSSTLLLDRNEKKHVVFSVLADRILFRHEQRPKVNLPLIIDFVQNSDSWESTDSKG